MTDDAAQIASARRILARPPRQAAGLFTTRQRPHVPLPAEIGSDGFQEAYSAALAGTIAEKKRDTHAAGTIGALVASYLQSAEYRQLRDTTKKGYRFRIEAVRESHRHRTVSGMTAEGIRTKILAPYADRPGQRLALLKMLRILIRHAIGIGWLHHDPSLGIERPKTNEVRSWTEEEIAIFERRWPIGTRERLAFALMLYTGQRRSDVHRMTWADVAGDAIRVVQQKTGAKLTIPLHMNLLSILSDAPRDHVTILNTVFGRPFTVAGFGAFMRDAITAAGLPLECRHMGCARPREGGSPRPDARLTRS